jgi:hypothetical protein
MIIELNFNLFCFMREKACSHMYVLQNTLSKFRANLRNSEI